MRLLITVLVRRMKRDPSWRLDPAMPTAALLTLVFASLVKAVRGSVRRIGLRRSRGMLMLGRHVTLRNKRCISVGRSCIAEDYSEIQGLSRHGITLGDRVTVGRFAMIRPSGYYGGELGEGMVVGDNSNIGPYSYIGCSGFVRIGSNVLMGARVSLHAENHTYADVSRPIKAQGVARAPITIEDDCWIGGNAMVLAGVTIGRGTVVAAGSVVTRDVPPYSVVAGVPARVIRSRFEQSHSAKERALLDASPEVSFPLDRERFDRP